MVQSKGEAEMQKANRKKSASRTATKKKPDQTSSATRRSRVKLPDGAQLMSEVEPEEAQWIWYPYLPLEHQTFIDGPPGASKSTVITDIAARITRGDKMPNDSPGLGEARGVVICTTEESTKHTVSHRLKYAKADASKVIVHGKKLTLPRDFAVIENLMNAVDAALVVIDPITGYLGSAIGSNPALVDALSEFESFAEQLEAAVLTVRHWTKNAKGPAIYRGLGGYAASGTARVGLAVGPHPEDATMRCLAQYKQSVDFLGGVGVTQTYALNGQWLEWLGPEPNVSADDLPTGKKGKQSAPQQAEAEQIIRDILADGPVAATEVHEAIEEAGLSKRTGDSAKKALGVQSERVDGAWYWQMP